jgi:hypothetical protein
MLFPGSVVALVVLLASYRQRHPPGLKVKGEPEAI